MINILLSQHTGIGEEWARSALSKVLKPGMKAVIIPFSYRAGLQTAEDWEAAYGADGKYSAEIAACLAEYGITELEWVNFFGTSHSEAKEMVSAAGLIFLPGGLPDRTMERLERFELIEAIENFDGVIMGISAGAMVQCREYHITPDGDYAEFTYQKGMNILREYGVEVHYEGTKVQNEGIARVISERGRPVWAIGNRGGVIRTADGKYTAFGEAKLVTELV